MRSTGAHRRLLAAIAIAVLSACSNGRGSVSDPATGPVQEPPPAPPPVPPPDPTPQPPPDPTPQPPPTSSAAMAGYWKGTATDEDDRRFDAVALIDVEGNAQWLFTRSGLFDDDGFVVSANVCCEAQFEADVNGKELGETRTRGGDIAVEVDGSALSGELEFHDRDYRFTLNAAPEYNHGISLATLAGVYTLRTNTLLGEEVTLTVTIGSDGRLNGSYSNGCVFDGNASIPDTSHNMVKLQIDLANCGSSGSSKTWNGAYTGLGLLLSDDNVFYHSVVGPTWFGPQSVER